MTIQNPFSPRLTAFLSQYKLIEANLDRAFGEMEGRNRRRAEFERPYASARDALLDIHLRIGGGELPEIYGLLVHELNKKMLTTKNKRNAIIQAEQMNSSLSTVGLLHTPNTRVYGRVN